jgi:hypothetical protein
MSALDFAQALVDEGTAVIKEKVVTLYHRTVDFLRTRQRAYRLAFNTAAGKIVLDDLAKFCRAEVSCFDADPRLHAVLEGRREVWLRIVSHLNLNPIQLNAMYGGPKGDE